MVALQEELDWQVYALYGLSSLHCFLDNETAESFGVEPTQRPFLGGASQLPEIVRSVYEKRYEAVSQSTELQLIEAPEYKRPWLGRQGVYGHQAGSFDDRVRTALRSWLLDEIESAEWRRKSALTSVAAIADHLRTDDAFIELASEYRGQDTFDFTALVTELVESEAVPFLPVFRYKPSGLRKREGWERTWDLQRREDAIDARTKLPDGASERLTEEEAKQLKEREVGQIPVPPKYTSADFANGTYWRLRGKLDVPKERFIRYPHCERDADPTPVIAWAGWDHLQQAQALATYYVQMKESEGWTAERLTPLLAGLLELLPWLKQWHNDLDPQFGQRMGEYYEGFLDEEARTLGLTRDAIRAWAPPSRTIRGRKPRR
jgi:hypothetical protein